MRGVFDSMESRKARGVCIGVIVVTVAIMALLATFASCSAGTVTGDAGADAAVVAEPATQGVDKADEMGVSTVGDGVWEAASDVDVSGELASETAEMSLAETSPASHSDSMQAKETVSTSDASAPEGEEHPTPPQPQRKWVEDTEEVWVEDKAAWIEQIPVYGTVEVSICNVCGADVAGNTSSHGKAHMLAGEGSGHHSEVKQVVMGYSTVSHAAEGHWETRVVGGHWE